MLHTRFQGHRPVGAEEGFRHVFTIFWLSGHLVWPRYPKQAFIACPLDVPHGCNLTDWSNGFGEEVGK